MTATIKKTRERPPTGRSRTAPASASEPVARYTALDQSFAVMLTHDYALAEATAAEVLSFVRVARAADAAREVLAGEPTKVIDAAALFTAAHLRGEAQHGILQEEMVESTAAGQLAGSTSTTNPRQHANALRREGALLAIPTGQSFTYPTFQFDLHRRCIHPCVRQVNQLLGAFTDPWGVASWWFTGHEVLGGARPADLVGTPREEHVLIAAQADTAPVG
jgi:hypothetical protein